MRSLYILTFCLMALMHPVQAGQIVKTSLGEEVQLNEDFTWEYVNRSKYTREKIEPIPYDLMKIKAERARQWKEISDALDKKIRAIEIRIKFIGAEKRFKDFIKLQNEEIRRSNQAARNNASRRSRTKTQKEKDASKLWKIEYSERYKKIVEPLRDERASCNQIRYTYKPDFLYEVASYGYIKNELIPYKVIDEKTIIVEIDQKYIKLVSVASRKFSDTEFILSECVKCLKIVEETILGKKVDVYVCDIIPSVN